MSNNNGTGFWVIVALMLVMSIVAVVEAAIRFVSRKIGFASKVSARRRWHETALRQH